MQVWQACLWISRPSYKREEFKGAGAHPGRPRQVLACAPVHVLAHLIPGPPTSAASVWKRTATLLKPRTRFIYIYLPDFYLFFFSKKKSHFDSYLMLWPGKALACTEAHIFCLCVQLPFRSFFWWMCLCDDLQEGTCTVWPDKCINNQKVIHVNGIFAITLIYAVLQRLLVHWPCGVMWHGNDRFEHRANGKAISGQCGRLLRTASPHIPTSGLITTAI